MPQIFSTRQASRGQRRLISEFGFGWAEFHGPDDSPYIRMCCLEHGEWRWTMQTTFAASKQPQTITQVNRRLSSSVD